MSKPTETTERKAKHRNCDDDDDEDDDDDDDDDDNDDDEEVGARRGFRCAMARILLYLVSRKWN